MSQYILSRIESISSRKAVSSRHKITASRHAGSVSPYSNIFPTYAASCRHTQRLAGIRSVSPSCSIFPPYSILLPCSISPPHKITSAVCFPHSRGSNPISQFLRFTRSIYIKFSGITFHISPLTLRERRGILLLAAADKADKIQRGAAAPRISG